MQVTIKVKPRSYYAKDYYLNVDADSVEAAIKTEYPEADGIKEWKPGCFVAEATGLNGRYGGSLDNLKLVAWEVK